MVFDGALGAGCDDGDLGQPGGDGLFDDVLDNGLVHQGQHLLGHGLGGGEESGAVPGGQYDGLADGHGKGAAPF